VRIDLRTSLADALGVVTGNLVSLVGAGGKTSLMYALGREMASAGHPALLTTTTRLRYPAVGEIADLVLGEETAATKAAIESRLAGSRLVLAGRMKVDSKIAGFSPAFLESLRSRDAAWTIVAECDGAMGKSLKVPRDHEPPLAASTDILVVMVGADCLGKSLRSEEVFEGDLVAAVAGVEVGAVVGSKIIARAVLSPRSYLGRKPPAARFCVFMNKVDVDNLDRPGPDADRSQVASAFEVGMALKTDSAVDRVIYGALERPPAKGFLVLS